MRSINFYLIIIVVCFSNVGLLFLNDIKENQLIYLKYQTKLQEFEIDKYSDPNKFVKFETLNNMINLYNYEYSIVQTKITYIEEIFNELNYSYEVDQTSTLLQQYTYLYSELIKVQENIDNELEKYDIEMILCEDVENCDDQINIYKEAYEKINAKKEEEKLAKLERERQKTTNNTEDNIINNPPSTNIQHSVTFVTYDKDYARSSDFSCPSEAPYSIPGIYYSCSSAPMSDQTNPCGTATFCEIDTSIMNDSINAQRTSIGKNSLKLDNNLVSDSNSWNYHMYNYGYRHANLDEVITNHSPNGQGENIQYASYAITVTEAQQRFINSPGHYQNMTSELYTKYGTKLLYVDSNQDGIVDYTFVTQRFM